MTNAPRAVLLLDVGLEATGVAIATLHDDGPHVNLSVIEPAAGLSTAARNEKRSCIYFGDLAERLFKSLRNIIIENRHIEKHPLYESIMIDPYVAVFAELPSMGAMNASGMRAMSIAIAAYRAACITIGALHVDYIRNDVIAAAIGTKRVSDETKLQTRALVAKTFIVDQSALPKTKLVKHRRTGAMVPVESIEKLRDNAFDAAAILFAARDHELLRVTAGWGDVKFEASAGIGRAT